MTQRPEIVPGVRCRELEAAATFEATTSAAPSPARESDGGSAGAPPPAAPTASSQSARSGSSKPVIVVSTNIPKVVDQAEDALLADPRSGLYVRGKMLVRVVRDFPKPPPGIIRVVAAPGAPVIDPVGATFLRERLSLVAIWKAKDGRKGKRKVVMPPGWVGDTLLARGEWRFPRLEAVVEAPTLRQDGTVLDKPGHDGMSSVLYEPRLLYPSVRHSPSHHDARAAADVLLDVICDFPFVAKCDRAVAVAAMLTIACRPAIKGPTPMFAICASTPGTGKGRLVDTITIGMQGREPTLVVPAEDGEEWRKRLLALGIGGHRVVHIDNVKDVLGCASLSSALTTCEISDRILGASRVITVSLTPTWLMSGNNVAFIDDMQRRVVPCDLDAKVERPEERSGFKYPNLIEHVKGEHPRLLVAALTILRAYSLAGRPRHGLPKLGSFEQWDDLVRGAVLWLRHPDLADPLATRSRLGAAFDGDTAIMRQVYHAWYTAFASTPVTLCEATAAARANAELDAALRPVSDKHAHELDPSRIGYAFRRWRNRIVDGLRLEHAGETSGSVQWRVVQVNSGGDGGHRGDDPPRDQNRSVDEPTIGVTDPLDPNGSPDTSDKSRTCAQGDAQRRGGGHA